MERRRIKHEASLEERLAEQARRLSGDNFAYQRVANLAGACAANMNEYRADLAGRPYPEPGRSSLRASRGR
jgi:hypothetical protein